MCLCHLKKKNLGKMCESVYLFGVLCACVFVFESSNVSEILQPCFIQCEVRGSSTNSFSKCFKGADGCPAVSPAVPSTKHHCRRRRRHNTTLPRCHSAPHSPASLSQQPTNSPPSHYPPHCHHGNCVHTHPGC